MSVVNNMIRTYGRAALEKRLASLGKGIGCLLEEDVEEILICLIKDSEKYVIDYDAYFARLVVVNKDGNLFINL